MVNSLPPKLSPMLATLAATVPAAGDWILEIKFHGYRIMARRHGGGPTVIDHPKRLGIQDARSCRGDRQSGMRSSSLDEEVVVLNKDGLRDFNALQNSFQRSGGLRDGRRRIDGARRCRNQSICTMGCMLAASRRPSLKSRSCR